MEKTNTPTRNIREKAFQAKTQAEFSEMIGITQSAVSRLETGEYNMSTNVQRLIRQQAKERGLAWNDSWLFDAPL